MLTAIRSYTLELRIRLKRLLLDKRIHTALDILRKLLMGFCLSAGSLAHRSMPLSLALVVTGRRNEAIVYALGGMLGFWVFWQRAGYQGLAWLAAGLTLALIVGDRPSVRSKPSLLSAAAALIVAVAGLLFRFRLQDATPVPIYFLRIGLAFGIPWLRLRQEQSPCPMKTAVNRGIWALALAQISPSLWFCPAMVLAGALAIGGSFPTVAMTGLALDLSQVYPVPMTGILCAVYFLRQLPVPRRLQPALTPVCYIAAMGLLGIWSPEPAPMLLLGGFLGHFPAEPEGIPHRRGETGAAQVRLELAAGVLAQLQQQLLETPVTPIDEKALIRAAAQRACGSCPCRKSCREQDAAASLPEIFLHRPLSEPLGIFCRKEGRLLQELRRAQEQLRLIRSGREQQREYRSAVLQQFQFLSEFMQDLSDQLGRRLKAPRDRFQPQITLSSRCREGENGDRLQSFRGIGANHFVVLCDGMGTGMGATAEAAFACSVFRRLLTAGLPAEHALRTFNSLCVLRGLAGASTVDLAQLELDTGKVHLYKWGAGESYLLGPAGPEKIGTAGPPPGLSVTQTRETVERLSLRRGETLILCSDGVTGEEVLSRCWEENTGTPGELASRILESGAAPGGDDATVALIRLTPIP